MNRHSIIESDIKKLHDAVLEWISTEGGRYIIRNIIYIHYESEWEATISYYAKVKHKGRKFPTSTK